MAMDPVPSFSSIPGDIYVRQGTLPPSDWDARVHPWGQFNYVAQGVMELQVGEDWMVSPTHYAIWIPPGVHHSSRNRGAVAYRSAYLSVGASAQMPSIPTALAVSSLLREILDELARRDIGEAVKPEDRRLSAVALDLILAAPVMSSFLPLASGDVLKRILSYAETSLQDSPSALEVAERHHISVRSLERLAKRELGMGFGEWRSRLRFLRAIDALGSDRSITQIADDLGYANSTSFSEMFKRHSRRTPDQYRRGLSPLQREVEPSSR